MDKYLSLISAKKQEVEFLRSEIKKLEEVVDRNRFKMVDLDSDKYELKTKIKQLQLKKEEQEQRPQKLKRKRLKWIIETIIVLAVANLLIAMGMFIKEGTFSITVNQFLTFFCVSGITGTLGYLYETNELRGKRININLIALEEEINEMTQLMETKIKNYTLLKEKNNKLKSEIKDKEAVVININRKIRAIEELRTEFIEELLSTALAQDLDNKEIPVDLQQSDVKVKKLVKGN